MGKQLFPAALLPLFQIFLRLFRVFVPTVQRRRAPNCGPPATAKQLMKKKLLTTLWLLAPVCLLAFHYGPGQRGLKLDQAQVLIEKARLAEKNSAWLDAIAAYGEAIAALPPGQDAPRQRLQLAKAKCRMFSGELPEAMADMEALLADMLKEQAAAPLLREVRASLATAQYYAAWLMRLEGAEAGEWTGQADEARQNFRLLAEETALAGIKEEAVGFQKNLEATIRLARMDISELQGLPLPKECEGCKNCSQKCRKQREAKKKEAPPKVEPQDSRKAGSGKRPEGSGS